MSNLVRMGDVPRSLSSGHQPQGMVPTAVMGGAQHLPTAALHHPTSTSGISLVPQKAAQKVPPQASDPLASWGAIAASSQRTQVKVRSLPPSLHLSGVVST